MSTDQQRCPACDSAFTEGEAVLRCSICRALHHPGCWIEGGGCAARPKHESVPEPLAFHVPEPVIEAIPEPPGSPKVPGPPRPQTQIGGKMHTGPVGPKTPVAARGTPPLDNPPNPGQLGGRTQRLPTIYTHRGILRFWYLPVGALLASFVAFAVIFAVDYLSGDDTPAVVVAPTATPTEEATLTATASASTVAAGTPEPTETPSPTAIPEIFQAGDTALVGGTGGDCLNVRAAAGLESAAVDCIDDGTMVTIVGGPLAADSFIWWQIEAPNATGWAVEIYLDTP